MLTTCKFWLLSNRLCLPLHHTITCVLTHRTYMYLMYKNIRHSTLTITHLFDTCWSPVPCTVVYLDPEVLEPHNQASSQHLLLAVLMREGLVRIVTSSDVPGRWVDVWRSGTCTCHSCTMYWFIKLPHSCVTPPHVHPTSDTSLHGMNFTRSSHWKQQTLGCEYGYEARSSS